MGQGISSDDVGLSMGGIANSSDNGNGDMSFLEGYSYRQERYEDEAYDSDIDSENTVYELKKRRAMHQQRQEQQAVNIEAPSEAEADNIGISEVLKSRLFYKGSSVIPPVPAKDNLFAPKRLIPDDTSARSKTRVFSPDETLSLHRVIGYRGHDCRHNLYYDSSAGNIIYHVASVGIIMDVRKDKTKATQLGNQTLSNKSKGNISKFGSQKFVTFHCNIDGQGKINEARDNGQNGQVACEISCMTVCHNVKGIDIAASCDDSGRVCIWECGTRKLLNILQNKTRNDAGTTYKYGVACMCFTRDGRYLALVGKDQHHTIAIYEWNAQNHIEVNNNRASNKAKQFENEDEDALPSKKGRLLLTCPGDTRRITSVRFNEFETPLRLITCGDNHLKFYTIYGDRLIGKHAVFQKQSTSVSSASPSIHSNGTPVTTTCMTFLPDGSTLVGTISGSVYRFLENESHASKRYNFVHRGVIFDMCYIVHTYHNNDSHVVLTCGKDGKVKLFSTFMELKKSIDISLIMKGIFLKSGGNVLSDSYMRRVPCAISMTYSDNSSSRVKSRHQNNRFESIESHATKYGEHSDLHAHGRINMENKLLLGLNTCDIIELDFDDIMTSSDRHIHNGGQHHIIMQGHGSLPPSREVYKESQNAGGFDYSAGSQGDNEIICLSSHPSSQLIASTCHDCTLRLWKINEQRLIAVHSLPGKGTSLHFNPKHSDIVAVADDFAQIHIIFVNIRTCIRLVSFDIGKVTSNQTEDLMNDKDVAHSSVQNVRGHINVLKFSPCGRYLAVGVTKKLSNSSQCYPKTMTRPRHNYALDRQTVVIAIYAAVGSYNVSDIVLTETLDRNVSSRKDLSFILQSKCYGLTSQVRDIDWSGDSKYIQANSSTGELLFFDISSSAVVAGNDDRIRTSKWSSNDCAISYNTCGVWPTSSSIHHITRCRRSNEVDDEDDAMIATTDIGGKICLYRYPADVGRAQPRTYNLVGDVSNTSKQRIDGPVEAPMDCCFSFRDKYLVSSFLSTSSSCILVWRIVDNDDDESDQDELDTVTQYSSNRGNKRQTMILASIENGVNIYEPVSSVDGLPNPLKNHSLAELGAKKGYRSPLIGKPCMTEIEVPHDFKLDVHTAYNHCRYHLIPSWIYGYRGYDTRQNIFYTNDGYIAYHAGCFGVILNPLTRTQRHITDSPDTGEVSEGNVDDILCLCRSPHDKTIFATGEIAFRPRIIVWSSITMKAISELHGYHRQAIISMCFNRNGSLLATVGYLDDGAGMSVGIYDWRKEILLCTYPCGKTKINHLNWSLYDDTIITVGQKHIKFVFHAKDDDRSSEILSSANAISTESTNIVRKGCSLSVIRGKVKDVAGGKMQLFLCSTFTGIGISVVSCGDGSIYMFVKDSLSKIISQAHNGCCQTVFAFQDLLISGGDDGIVRFWNGSDFKKLHHVKIPDALATSKQFAGIKSRQSIRSISCDSRQRVLIGTNSNEIYEISDVPRLIARGHSEGELWGFCLHPYKDVFASGSDDGTLRLWSWSSRTVLNAINMREMLVSNISSLMTRYRSSQVDGEEIGTINDASNELEQKLLDILRVHADDESVQDEHDEMTRRSGTADDGGQVNREEMTEYVNIGDESSKFNEIRINIKAQIRSIAFSHQEDVLAVGTIDGYVMILALPSLALKNIIDNESNTVPNPAGVATQTNPLTSRKFSKKSTPSSSQELERQTIISVIKYSPNGRYLCVGSHANTINIYEVTDRYRHVGSCRGHTAPITKVDWTVDSKYIASNSADYHVMYWSIPTCRRIEDKNVSRDFYYQTYSRILGWESLGIWYQGAEGNDINSVDRSHDGALLATGDDRGLVTLFKYPALGGRGCHHGGHGSDVTNVSFAPSGGVLFSTANDGNIIEWRVVMKGGKSLANGSESTIEYTSNTT